VDSFCVTDYFLSIDLLFVRNEAPTVSNQAMKTCLNPLIFLFT